jgi:hypothetical protein
LGRAGLAGALRLVEREVIVYQAYPPLIVEPGLAAGRFVPRSRAIG